MRSIYLVACLLSLAGVASGQQSVTFNRDIRPILSDKCFACHGPGDADRKAKLRLDIPDGDFGSLTPRGDAFVIKPGEPEASELWRRITTDDADDLMPPEESHKEPLTQDEQKRVRQWILDGAAYQSFWSFIPPVKTPPAPVKNAAWGAGMVDNRILARLEEAGLEPKAEADKRTLLRRLTFDLTGLPPTLEEIDAFLKDDSPNAYEKVVDDLLARDAYGEHMTRYWSDLVRLADTNGMHKDFNRDFSTYRDWLIRAFNSNMPFDDFIRYQLAGDLYENPTQDQLVASGFNRLHLIIDRGTALPEESLHKNVLDRVEAFGTAFLGLTVQCAQCHSHKYDPISLNEYYQFYAFFNNFAGEPETVDTPERGLQPPFIYLTSPEQQVELDTLNAEQTRLNAIRAAIQQDMDDSGKWPKKFEQVPVPWIWKDDKAKAGIAEFRTVLTLDETPASAIARFTGMSSVEVQVNGTTIGNARLASGGVAVDISDLLFSGDNIITAIAEGEPGFAFILEYATGGETKTLTTSKEWMIRGSDGLFSESASEIFTPDHKNTWTKDAKPENIARLSRDVETLDKRIKRFTSDIPAAMVMAEREPMRQAHLLERGMYDAPGETVERGTPAFLPALMKKETPYSRMDLANWLVEPNHPLTARVVVNRFWQQLFGVGLVKTSEDFGSQGEWPSHPELLDNLALFFMESGWDVKALLREMALSNTYKQSSDISPDEYEADPENRLLARGPRYRMDAEMIRDQILAVSGQLNREMYGRSVKPPQPPGLWEMVSMAEPKTYVADKDDNIYRRSLYTYWRRGMPPPQMTILNAPSREYCVARRERTNTPLQALLMMNETEYFKAAKACVKSTLLPEMDEQEGLSLIYEKITSQEPDAGRLNLMEQTLQEFKEIYAKDKTLTETLTPDMGDADFQERVNLSAWTMITHGLMNLELAKVKR